MNDWYERAGGEREDFDFQTSSGSQSEPSSRYFSRITAVSGPIIRLNDVLQASGFDPAPLDADLSEIVNACVNAIGSLSHRYFHAAIKQRSISEDEPAPVCRNPPAPQVKTEDVCYERDDEKKVILGLKQELRETRKALITQKHDLKTFQHQIRSRDNEIENLRSFMKAQAKDEDRRSALTMTSMRERKIGSNAFVLINNLQRQVESLERENETLSKKCMTMSNRVRARSPAKKAEELDKVLRAELLELKEEKAARDKEINALRDELGSRPLKKVRNVKSVLVSTDFFVSPEEKCVQDLRKMLSSEEVIESVRRLIGIEREILPPLKVFVRELIALLPEPPSDSDDMESLKREIGSVLMQKGMIEIASETCRLLDCNEDEALGRIRSLLSENMDLKEDVYRDPVLLEAMKTVGVSSREKLVTVIRSLEFKFQEISNFYNRLLALLSLPKGSSYAAVMREIETRLFLPRAILQSEVANSDSGESDAASDISSTNNLALVREIIPLAVRKR